MSNSKGKRNCSDSDEATGRGDLQKQKESSFKTILLSKSTNPDNKLDNQTLTKSDGLEKLSIKIIDSPKKQSSFIAESTDSKMLQSERLVLEVNIYNALFADFVFFNALFVDFVIFFF